MDWTAIISGAAAGAIVTGIGAVITTALNAKSQKEIARLNHDHETELQLLDDRRRLRDSKINRLRPNLEKLADTTSEVHTNVWIFIQRPDTEYLRIPEQAVRLNEMLIEVRGAILLDTDSIQLFERLNKAYLRYQLLAEAWRDYREAQKNGDRNAPQMGGDARTEAGNLMSDLKDLLEEPRAILERLEQPIAAS